MEKGEIPRTRRPGGYCAANTRIVLMHDASRVLELHGRAACDGTVSCADARAGKAALRAREDRCKSAKVVSEGECVCA
ncbi:MAG: hypothetical protein ACE15C_02775 [Phycisphaerae bacterium]